MATRYVVDTNVLVTLDRREPEKRERAREVLRRVGGAGTAAPGAGPLRFPDACRKLRPGQPEGTAGGRAPHARLPGLAAHRPRGARSPAGRQGAHASYYDAQIWAVARLGRVAVVLSEDFNPGAVLDGVSFTGSIQFDLAALG